MRGAVDSLESPVPVLGRLPAILQEDEFLSRWLTGFDASLAPVFSVLDNLEAYIRPGTTPEDFLPWLAAWVDLPFDEAWSPQQAREVVAEAALVQRRAGTARGIQAAIVVACGPGASVEVTESGGTHWSVEPGQPLPGTRDGSVRIAVNVPSGDADQLARRLERVARRVVPAHVTWELSVTVGEG